MDFKSRDSKTLDQARQVAQLLAPKLLPSFPVVGVATSRDQIEHAETIILHIQVKAFVLSPHPARNSDDSPEFISFTAREYSCRKSAKPSLPVLVTPLRCTRDGFLRLEVLETSYLDFDILATEDV
ncbi:hypothetical protein RRG08_000928 [Elysia crispata]|uniref:Uncharacterized protein n=1 Tax=Elysia crispata TaxID=231223 RepID=A0AAE1D9U0_9GAST|nr:hypothetical protein RRG08_000928 [Elysia crispata]